MMSSQYGTIFTKSHYEKIIKMYSIWVCVNPPLKKSYTITLYHTTEENIVGNAKESPDDYDLMNVIIITLGNDSYKNLNGILRVLNILLVDHLTADERIGILRDECGIGMTPALEKGMAEMCNVSEYIYERGMERGRLDDLRNIISSLNLTTERAMNALGIPPAEQAKYAELLRNTPTN